ncbi:hypothetical protein GGF46_001120 [Coemansia sp. RSA 552]|nr:hypothetical protein GGF46_001120 [Coemansia sp. RSA 552]
MKLPTVLAVGFASVASAYTVLDAENFDTATMEGYWLVKYYSPTCPWSRRFAPVWEKVYGGLEGSLASRDLYFAEVDCKANGPLCVKAGIDGYPTVVYYNQGVNMGEVPGGQAGENLERFAQSI